MTEVYIKWHSAIKEIKEEDWDLLINTDSSPFYSWHWLNALEESDSISIKHGWQPLHLSCWRDGQAIAFAPLYLKNHSYGEFIFDQTFSQIANEIGLRYYPKLIGMSPLSPITGYRFFIRKGEDEKSITAMIIKTIDEFAIENKILSCNFLYVDEEWGIVAENCGCRKWINKNSIWLAEDSKTFSDYLLKFNANQRRNIKRERQSIEKLGISITPLTSNEIDKKIILSMYNLYESHCSRWGPWGSKYLSKDFFHTLEKEKHKHKLILFSAHMGDPTNPIAMSMCIQNRHLLWGRYWGSHKEIDNLHFEICYYSPIEWGLKNGIRLFDPGAGGSHKQRRGFLANPTASLHRWYNKDFDQYMQVCLTKINKLVFNEINTTNKNMPYKVIKNSFLKQN